MNIINIILACLFALFAWLQLNDVDPEVYYKPSSVDAVLWFLFYLIIATGFILLVAKKRLLRWYFILAIIACFVEMSLSGPGLAENLFGEAPFTMTQQSMQADDPRVELSREFFGAVIALVGIGFQWWQTKRSS